MAKSTKDLKKTGKNPRIVTDNSLEKLNDNLVTFGDLGGVVYNTLLGELVSANQRTSLFNLKKNRIEYTEQLKTPTEDGTTAYGYIIIDNQKFSYREVKWEEEKHKAAVLLANTHAGQFDFSMLESEFADIDFEGLGMDDLKADLDRFVLGDLEDAEGTEGDNTKSTYEAEEDDFEVPEIEEIKTDIVVGDLFEIGRHRLLCGDSTDKETVERLMDGEKADIMVTDPPYGINLNTDYSGMGKTTTKYAKIENDESEFDIKPIISIFKTEEQYIWGGDYFVNSLEWMKGTQIIWAKRHSEEENKVFGSAFESLWVSYKCKKVIWFIRPINQSSERLGVHPTQKPVERMSRCINMSKLIGIIADPFLGSGSTMVAAHQLNRKCYGLELSPQYCQVIINRMRKLDPSVKITKNGIEI